MHPLPLQKQPFALLFDRQSPQNANFSSQFFATNNSQCIFVPTFTRMAKLRFPCSCLYYIYGVRSVCISACVCNKNNTELFHTN